MNFLVIYDSLFGNTKIIAQRIAEGLGDATKIAFVQDVKKEELGNYDLLVIGSPINGWRPSERMLSFLGGLGPDILKGKKVASFDTRINIFIHGDATKKILESLLKAGGECIADPEFFYVKGKEGPISDGEENRAIEWGKKVKESIV